MKTAKNSFKFKLNLEYRHDQRYKWSPITNTVTWERDGFQEVKYSRKQVDKMLKDGTWIVEE